MIILLFIFQSCKVQIANEADQDNSQNSLSDADIEAIKEVLKEPGELCACDSECEGKNDLNGVCIFGICGLETQSCEYGCPTAFICKETPFFENDLCFKKFRVISSKVDNCEGVSDYDLSCINNDKQHLNLSCSKYTEKIKCAEKDELDHDLSDDPFEVLSDMEKDLSICENDEDWFKVDVEKGKYMEACIVYYQPSGDINLKLFDKDHQLLASRNPDTSEPDEFLDVFNTGLECVAVFSKDERKTYYLSVSGNENDHNSYRITVRFLDFKDGQNCLESGFTREECDEIMQFPIPDKNSVSPADNYRFTTLVNYRFGSREIIMATRHAIKSTMEAYPGTNPIWISIVSQKNGLSPGADMGGSFSYNSYANHTEGKAIDISFFQKNNDNGFRNICNEAPSIYSMECNEEDRNQHLVDIDKQLFFIQSLYNTGVFSGLFIVDWLIAEEIVKQAKIYNKLDPGDINYVSDEELEFIEYYVYGNGLPNHHTHIHIGT